jgi:protein-S-isoprenylcysteine O-methyltransferase Ste14
MEEGFIMRNSSNPSSSIGMYKVVKRLTLREDWPLVPYLLCVIIGLLITFIDFIFVQNQLTKLLHGNFQITISFMLGLILIVMAGIFRALPRRALVDAGFKSIWNTPRLQIVEGHRLVTDGFYKFIRHPVYIGELARNFCLPMLLSSLWGFLIMFIAMILLLFRIHIEEQMLLAAFGSEYESYQKTTKKLIPFIY